MKNIKSVILSSAIIFSVVLSSCDPFNTIIENKSNEDAVIYYEADNIKTPPANPDTLKIVTWNIKFGGGRIDFFFDCYGDRVLMTEDEVISNIDGIIEKIKSLDPDIIYLQEADILSKRSAFIDQVQMILDNTDMNYGVYASQWQADYVPSDGVGKVNSGNAILSKYELTNAERIPLQLIEEDPGYVQYFYLRRNVLKADVMVNGKNIVLFGTHTSAYSTDGTRLKQLQTIKDLTDAVNNEGKTFILAGDFNTIPPNSAVYEHFDDAACEEGSDYYEYGFAGQLDYMQMFYDDYSAAISLQKYGTELDSQRRYFTFTSDKNGFWNRKLDYIFTNGEFTGNSGHVHQTGNDDGIPTMPLSDHAPVSVKFSLN